MRDVSHPDAVRGVLSETAADPVVVALVSSTPAATAAAAKHACKARLAHEARHALSEGAHAALGSQLGVHAPGAESAATVLAQQFGHAEKPLGATLRGDGGQERQP